jgi:NTE family protein
MREHFGDTAIEALGRPFAAVATDLVSGRPHVATHGPLVPALRASISIPGVFQPVVTGDAVLVDGQLVEPLPVAACRALGAEVVIAVDLFGDQDGVADAGGIAPGSAFDAGLFDMLSASFVVLTASLTRAQLARAPAEVVVVPEIGDIAPHQFQRAGELIARGADAAHRALPAVRAALGPPGR